MPLTLDETIKYEKELMRNTLCLARSFDANHCSCGGETIGSHSIARQTLLKRIADNGEVYVWEQNPEKMYYRNTNGSDAEIELKKWGIKKASVFHGFCKNHDELLFNRIDCPIISFDKEVLLQMHYRAISYEYFHKKTSTKFLEYVLDNTVYNAEMDQFISNNRLGLADLELEKNACESAYGEKNANDCVKGVVYSFDTDVPVMCVSSLTPCYTVDGHSFYESLEAEHAPSIGLTLGMDANDHAFWALTYTRYDKYVKKFLDNLNSYRNKRLLDIAVLFSLHYSQNACCCPSWYERLQKWQKKCILRGFNRLSEYDNEPVTGIRILNKNYNVERIL